MSSRQARSQSRKAAPSSSSSSNSVLAPQPAGVAAGSSSRRLIDRVPRRPPRVPTLRRPTSSNLALRRGAKKSNASTNVAYILHAHLLKQKLARLEDENNRLNQSWVLNLETDGDWLESLRSEGVIYAYEDGLEEFGMDDDGNLFFGKAHVAFRSEERRRCYVNCSEEMRLSTRDMELRYSRARIRNEMLLRVNAEADAQLRLELMEHVCAQQKPKAVTLVGKLLDVLADWYEGRG